MYAEQILGSFVQEKKRAYQPQFRLRKEKRGWRVFDGETAIAFFYPTFFDIWSFSPCEPPVQFNEEDPGAVVDLYTVRNTFVNLAAHGWPRHWFDEGQDPSRMLTWKWTKKAGDELEAEVSGAFPGGERIRWVVRVWYDPAWARYRYEVTIDAWKLEAEGMEPFNMMLAGALCCCAEDRRWTHTIYEDAGGQLRRLVHSNALFHATDYAASSWRTRNAPYRGAWVAYAAHEEFNPAVLIRDNNVPLKLATCSQLFDEHIIWNDAGTENLDEEGFFHFRMVCEFVNMGAPLARKLLRQAQDPVKPRQWREQMVALAFHMGVENSFEEEVDPWEPEDCPLLGVPRDPEGRVGWADEAARSGQRSLRLTNTIGHERNEVSPVGAVCNVKPHTRYRLSGWIKTSRVERFARLELASIEYTFENVIDQAASGDVSGTKDWTRVEVILDSGEEAYLLPVLRLYGSGTAWFDDVMLAEVCE